MGDEIPTIRLYQFLLESRQAIIRESGLPELLQSVCSYAADLFDCVRITPKGSDPIVSQAAGDSPPPDFWDKYVTDGGRPVPSIALEDWGRWSSAALFPLTVAGEVWGSLAFYSFEAAAFESFSGLLQDLANDLGSGIQARIQNSRQRESEQFLSDMANLVPGTFYKLKLEAGELDFLYVSPGVDLLLPLTPGRVRSDPGLVFRALHPADRRRFVRSGIRSRDFLTVFNLEFRLLRPNGSVVWVFATAFPQKQGGAVVWTGLAIDVTPQNKLQEALQREQELLAVILNNIGDGVVAVDEHQHLALVNRTAARLLDAAGVIESMPWQSLDPAMPWDAVDQFRPWYRQRSDGTVLHLEAHVSDLMDPVQRLRGRVLLLRDMTDRDRIEERLRQSEKLESIGLLAGGIAHDFNNLLTGVFGFIQLARMNSEQPERVVSYLDHALGPFQRARTLTQQLLTFAKGGEVAKAPLRLAEMLPTLLQFTLAGSTVAFEWEVPSVTWAVLANEAQLHQVFENLLQNAKQALPQGGRVKVVIRNVPAPGPEGRGLASGDYLDISIEDNGPGIPDEIASKVFDPFFTTRAGGTGLGLSICFSIMKKHGGSIELESSAGSGALFRLFLPAQPIPTAI